MMYAYVFYYTSGAVVSEDPFGVCFKTFNGGDDEDTYNTAMDWADVASRDTYNEDGEYIELNTEYFFVDYYADYFTDDNDFLSYLKQYYPRLNWVYNVDIGRYCRLPEGR